MQRAEKDGLACLGSRRIAARGCGSGRSGVILVMSGIRLCEEVDAVFGYAEHEVFILVSDHHDTAFWSKREMPLKREQPRFVGDLQSHLGSDDFKQLPSQKNDEQNSKQGNRHLHECGERQYLGRDRFSGFGQAGCRFSQAV